MVPYITFSKVSIRPITFSIGLSTHKNPSLLYGAQALHKTTICLQSQNYKLIQNYSWQNNMLIDGLNIQPFLIQHCKDSQSANLLVLR